MTGEASFEATLRRVSLRMASSLDLAEVLSEITRGLVTDLDAALARIWLIGPDEPTMLKLAASAGLSERLDGSRSRVPIGSLKIGEIAAKRTALCTTDLKTDPRFADRPWFEANKLVTFAGYPLLYRDELLGVLAIFSRNALDAAELDRLALFAAQAAVAIKNAELFAKVDALRQRLAEENTYLREVLDESRPSGIIGESPPLRALLVELERVASTSSTVLVSGETGTGKELIARAIHELSPRRTGPLIKVNCGALVPSLVESELFGHEKGAFTGAVSRRLGRFELAHGGTLFLDEITELPLEAQAKLLRVLQEHEVDRVGGTKPVRVDVRIIAATNRDLAAEVRANRFRSDLFFRLNVFPLHVPPLRERREDIPLLATAFLDRLATRLATSPKRLDDDALAYLMAYDWPGNVRELENVLERAAILERTERLVVADFPDLAAAEAEPSTPNIADASSDGSLKERVSKYERSLIADALKKTDQNQSEAARLLRMSRATLQYKMKLFKL